MVEAVGLGPLSLRSRALTCGLSLASRGVDAFLSHNIVGIALCHISALCAKNDDVSGNLSLA